MVTEFVSDEELERMAMREPDKLLELLRSGRLECTRLTYAAEYAGKIRDSAKVLPVLLPMLSHEKAYVREGVIYGLWHHATEDVRKAVRRIAREDESKGVREAANEMLKEADWR